MKSSTIHPAFGDKHKEYIRNATRCIIYVAEGAVRAGKTIDNIAAFKFDLAREQLTLAKRLNPTNNIPYWAENYIDFLELMNEIALRGESEDLRNLAAGAAFCKQILCFINARF